MLSFLFSFGQSSLTKFKNEIRKGFCENATKACIEKQYRYLNACNSLGDFYFRRGNYKTALRYYELPLDLNGHSTNIQTNAAYKLRNDIIAKAGDMLFFGNGYLTDTISSFYYHFQYPLNYTRKQKEKYSEGGKSTDKGNADRQ